MANIHIIDSIRLNHKGLFTLDENSKWVEVHKQQGDLDGACAIYSLVMAMLCNGLLSDDDTKVYNRPDRRTEKGKLLYQFFNFIFSLCAKSDTSEMTTCSPSCSPSTTSTWSKFESPNRILRRISSLSSLRTNMLYVPAPT